jgi:hypothetical protein
VWNVDIRKRIVGTTRKTLSLLTSSSIMRKSRGRLVPGELPRSVLEQLRREKVPD